MASADPNSHNSRNSEVEDRLRCRASFIRSTLEMHVTDTTVATAAISITSQEHFVPLPNHKGGKNETLEVSRCDGATVISDAAACLTRQRVVQHPATRVQTSCAIFFPKLNRICHHQAESTAPPNAWRGLLPLKSSRADVERLLGPPAGSVANSYSYETKEEKVRVLYSQGSCEQVWRGNGRVPADTVLAITVFPQTSILVKSLRLDMTIYKRGQEVHPENWVWYVSSETGVMVHAIQKNGGEEVMSTTYRPATKDEHLRCPKQERTRH